MAIKERLLKQLHNVQDGLRAMPPFHSRDLQAMRNALLQARDLCFQGLSENRFAEYKDTYDGLLLAIDQLAADTPEQGEIVSLCSELLQYTVTQTQKEIAFKKEIFFLPYKASMWDSLESVWKAADEDKEHCIAYVMPIPYADLTPEHTVAEWHCERGLFPKYVPTVNWEEFDLQEIHPDVIYIHNPYDEYNRVTSVESRYYSSVLKDQTDKLVYIPYFVLEELIPGNEIAEEAISGFILTPAVVNADEVIVQSEDMRQVYINVLIRNTNQKDRAYWEKRILGLGSPKIEKVLTSKKEDFELPESWAKIVKGKKVILYNTSLTAMLQNSDKVCDKLRYVFNIFKNRDDVAFWWRPHPLMKATIHSMRPEIEGEYCALERQYIEEGWGVYDDTGNLHRAITWSDAYYGDGSSVVQLYKETGNPIIYQNYNLIQEHYFDIADVEVSGNEAWFISRDINAIWKYDFIKENIEFIVPLDKGKLFFDLQYGRIRKFGNRLIVFPFLSHGWIVEYNIETQELNKIRLEDRKLRSQNSSASVSFLTNILYKNKVFLIGTTYPAIVEYDLDTHECKYYDEYLKWMDIENLNKGMLLDSVKYNGNCILMTCGQTNQVIEFDLEAKSFSCYNVGDANARYLWITCDGEAVWLIPKDPGHAIVRWDKQINSVRTYDSYPLDVDFTEVPKGYSGFAGITYMGGRVYLFPDMANMVISVDIHTGEMKNDVLTKLICSDHVRKNKWCSFAKSFGDTTVVSRDGCGEILEIRNGTVVARHILKANISAINEALYRTVKNESCFNVFRCLDLYREVNMHRSKWNDVGRNIMNAIL